MPVRDTRVRHTFGVQPKEIHVVTDHNPSGIGTVGKVLTIFGSFEASVYSSCYVNASMAEGICQCR